MDREQTAEALDQLSMLFQAFPSGSDKSSPTMAKAYLLAIEGCTLDGLKSAVRRLIRGEVEDHNGHFAPTTAELAKTVRYEDYRLEAEAKHAARLLTRSETPQVEYQFTEEEMERRREQVDMLLGRTTLKRMPARDAA